MPHALQVICGPSLAYNLQHKRGFKFYCVMVRILRQF